MTAEERFNSRKNNPLYNTSYPLSPKQWQRYKIERQKLSIEQEKDVSLYIHIPFCKQLCKFCEYVRFKVADEETQLRYLKIIDNDIANFVNSTDIDVRLRGFDIGGGTPTALSHRALVELLLIMNNHSDMLGMEKNCFGSLEASFQTVDKEKIELIGSVGRYIKRMSFGLQNVNKAFLESNNRDNGTLAAAVNTFGHCRAAGIKVLNLDLMYGFPSQKEADFDATIKAVSELKPEHLTVYELRTNMLSNYSPADAERRYSHYNALYERITALGYEGHYGGNTFSLIGDDGLSSYLRHRMLGNGAYKGFGIAAQSKNGQGISYNIGKNHESLEDCLNGSTFDAVGSDVYLLPPEEMLAKYIAISGYCGRWRLSKMQEIIFISPLEKFKDEFEFLLSEGLIEITDDWVSITPKGFLHYGAILSLFYPI